MTYAPNPAALTPAQAIIHICGAEWFESLTPAEVVAIEWCVDVWSRPEQCIPLHRWNTCGLDGGRGFGKTRTIARWINSRVMAGLERHVALMAPTDDRVEEVQVESLIAYAEPWQRPELVSGELRWPNGVKAFLFTSEREGRTRSENISLSWCTELVDWKPGTREAAFKNIHTATRVGEARLVWDSTAKGRNEVRTLLAQWHAADPDQHVVIPGTMFDNPLLSTAYLRGQWNSYAGVRREEELFGKSFGEADGALWKQKDFDKTRVEEVPELAQITVTVDPATSTHDTADETGVMVGGEGKKDGHAYVIEDASGYHSPNEWGDIAVDRADPRKAGPRRGRIGIERKKLGDNAVFVIKSRAETKGMRVRVIGKDEPWPPWERDVLFVREYNPQESKGARAEGPAAETEAGRAHLVDPNHAHAPRFADLEKECTTYVPGTTARSPNRLDAFSYLVIEIRNLREDSPPDHGAEAALASRMTAELDRVIRASTAESAPRRVGVLSGAIGLGGGGRGRLGI